MQDVREIEASYQTPDPWGYQTNPEDAYRKDMILSLLNGRRFKRALDIGAGEGWITRDLPADHLFGYEVSDTAASRFPVFVRRETKPSGKYDLIIACGVMYSHYDWRRFIDLIKEHASGVVILCNIEAWEVPEVAELGVPLMEGTFPYREFIEKLRFYDTSSQHRNSGGQ